MQLAQVCLDGNIGIMPIFNDTLNTFATIPKIQFGLISSKYDMVQMLFWDAVAITFGDYLQLLNPVGPLAQKKFYGYLNDIVTEYVKNGNFDMFWVNANMHTYTELDLVYAASTKSFNSTKGPDPSMIDWLKTFTEPGQNAGQQCYGVLPKQLGILNWPNCHTHVLQKDLTADCTNTDCLEVFQ